VKFLVIGHQVTGASEHRDQITYLQMTKEWIDSGKKNKKIDCAFSLVTGGGIFVMNADSHEDLMGDLTSFPLRPFSDFEIYPLADFDKATDIVINEIRDGMAKHKLK